jgi:uncharacterized protein
MIEPAALGSAAGILAASLFGSIHCAAMCGGFACFYTGAAPGAPSHGATLLRAHATYNAGRLVSYLLLGGIAGAAGGALSELSALAGVARGATVVAGLLMIGWAISTIAAQRGVRLSSLVRWHAAPRPRTAAGASSRSPSPAAPIAWQRFMGGVLHSIRNQPAAVRAGITGLATTLLPCGWLYVFVAAAGGTGSAMSGMTLMFVFWLGTVPALLAVGAGAGRLLLPLRQRFPTLGAITILLMGVLAVSGRLLLSPVASPHAH